MKRFLLSFVMAVSLMVVISPSANAEILTYPCGPNGETYSVVMPAAIATSGTKCVGSLIIDSKVKLIDKGAFAGARLLNSVVIGDLVAGIGNSAFEGTPLTSVIIGNSVTTIGEAAFYNTQLTSVDIPNSVTTIGYHAFYNSQLSRVTIGNSVTVIENSVFEYTKLSSVEIPNSVKSIGARAFYNTPLTSVSIGDSVTEIGNNAFYNTQLTSVVIPSSVTTLGEGAFGGNLVLATISILDGLIYLNANAFERSNSITSILYCGRLTSFPITPTCPVERQAAIDAKIAIELKAKQEADFRALEELKAKQEAEAKAAAELKAKQEAAAKASAMKKVTITCVKGKLTKKVTAVKPKCPSGYKLKK